uniref:G-protein coupled receptors family 1 profile domain-containing protein n=1 Tax=Meloidogyne enterolobii TaxID=390850 RepID=A0A6V7WFI4_MELEN|nr:unnamed protein product [Meloidogyne enterolobii]
MLTYKYSHSNFYNMVNCLFNCCSIWTVCINVRASSEFWNKWFEFLTLYLLPCLAFLFLYSKICAVLWAKNRQLYEVPETKTSLSARDEPRLSDPGSAASRTSSTSAALLGAREEALRTRRNVVKMLVACVSVYFVCYSPIQAIFLSRQEFKKNETETLY